MNIVIFSGGETYWQAAGALHRSHNVTIIDKNKARNRKKHQVL